MDQDLTSPFLYTYPGFESEEVEPWHENGEEWRSLKVTFPDNIASHSKTQITHFGPDGLMRRHDTPLLTSLVGRAAQTMSATIGNSKRIQMPIRRRIYAYDQNKQKIPEPLLVSLDFGNLTFS